ncbi:DNA cytosine methyltransferase [Pseudolabrys sp. FHR47]|uniref:DNA cytosine methyltransferase n=1 Tax=Pseudolabrys sp. FHR47 TaxID=2562284 RepID=UPI0010BEC4D3|nr:DNA (cytosine-5-)-methyltransferase [Pseudolabrys sp. FHR47]
MSKLKAISLYTGVGGLDFGFEAAGFSTRVAVEIDPVACRVLSGNRPAWRVVEDDIGNVSMSRLLDFAGLRSREADVLIGGPPCQPFSKSGYWATGSSRRLEDARAGTLAHYLKVLKATLPRAFLLENVLGFSFAGKSEAIDFIRAGLSEINSLTGVNYSFSMASLNAADFGVPQLRERVFIVGARDGAPFKFPKATHGPKDETAEGMLPPYLTAWDAIGGLSQSADKRSLAVTGKWADLLPTIPEGKNYLWHTPRGGGAPLFGWRTRYWNFLLKLAKDQPSWTIQAQPGPSTGPFHWENRKLSAKELCRLQTFPNLDFGFCTRAEIQRLVGNGVPSALAEALALEIGAQLLGATRKRGPLSLIPSRKRKTPAAEIPKKVPKKYLGMVGSHLDHPGPGKGAGALRRLSKVA